jgi:hypothetical protein
VTRPAFEVGDRLFDVAFQRSPTGDDTTIDEGRRMLAAYFATYAGTAPSETRSAVDLHRRFH